ncbi:hypothetical protein ACMBCN_03140 [Candidatus Liberibacter asiaticus]|nr:hypothetical protein [Candidatus Liberibacter asiaticus]
MRIYIYIYICMYIYIYIYICMYVYVWGRSPFYKSEKSEIKKRSIDSRRKT